MKDHHTNIHCNTFKSHPFKAATFTFIAEKFICTFKTLLLLASTLVSKRTSSFCVFCVTNTVWFRRKELLHCFSKTNFKECLPKFSTGCWCKVLYSCLSKSCGDRYNSIRFCSPNDQNINIERCKKDICLYVCRKFYSFFSYGFHQLSVVITSINAIVFSSRRPLILIRKILPALRLSLILFVINSLKKCCSLISLKICFLKTTFIVWPVA